MHDNPRLIHVEWLDSRQPTPAWQFVDSSSSHTACNCVSVGFLVHEDDCVKVLAPNLADVGQEGIQASGMITIPVCSITRVTDLSQSPTAIAN